MNWLAKLFGSRTKQAASSSLTRAQAMEVALKTVAGIRSMGIPCDVQTVQDTNSMLPTLDSNAVFVFEICPFDALTEGDIVIYVAKGGIRKIHRLSEKTGKGWFVLGDANGTVDPELVTRDNFNQRLVQITYGRR